MTKTQILVSILFVLMILIVFVQSSSSRHGEHMPQIQTSIHMLMSAIGVFISGGAALAMFLKCIGGASLEQQSPWLFPMFSGLLLLHVHWSLSIPLGLIAVGFVGRRVCELFAVSNPTSSSND
jgi:hypothetical protein